MAKKKKRSNVWRNIRITMVCLAWIYVACIALLNLPIVRGWIASSAASALSELLETEVRIGSVNVGFLNNFTLDDLYVEDQRGVEMLRVAHVGATFNLRDLVGGQITIESAQLFGMKAALWREYKDSAPNFQFIINALSGEKKEPKTPLRLKISSIIMRHTDVTYDVENEPRLTNKFDPNHINVQKLALTAAVKMEEGKSFSVQVKRLDGKEINTGLELQKLTMNAVAESDKASLSGFTLKTNALSMSLDTMQVLYTDWGKGNNGRWEMEANLTESQIVPERLAFLFPQLGDIHSVLSLSGRVRHDERGWKIDDLLLESNDESVGMQLDATYGTDSWVRADIDTIWVDTELLPQKGGFSGDLALNINSLTNNVPTDSSSQKKQLIPANLPHGEVNGVASVAHRDGSYSFDKVVLSVISDSIGCIANADITSENLDMLLDAAYQHNRTTPSYIVDMRVNKFKPHSLGLINDFAGETLTLNLHANVNGNTANDLRGDIRLDSIRITTAEMETFSMDSCHIACNDINKSERRISVDGDFINAEITGRTDWQHLSQSVTSLLATHLPALVKGGRKNTGSNNSFTYRARISDSELLQHIVKADYAIDEPIDMAGVIDDHHRMMDLNVMCPALSFGGTTYHNVKVECKNSTDMLRVFAEADKLESQGRTNILINAKARNNSAAAQVRWDAIGTKTPMNGMVDALCAFNSTSGTLATDITLRPSMIKVQEAEWIIHPSVIQVEGGKLQFNKFQISHANQALMANGTVSSDANDSLYVDIDGVPIEYLQDLLNFHPVDFSGKMLGHAVVSGATSNAPQIDANIHIDNMCFEGGRMGEADLYVCRDEATNGISISGIMNDTINCYTGITGYVSPANRKIDLLISTHNTSAAFLNGLIGSVFSDISGKVNGNLRVAGDLGDINILGDIATDVDMTLRPTNVRYSIEGDTLRFGVHRFSFDNVTIHDVSGNTGTVNGAITHRNLKNFGYTLDIIANNLTCYDEDEFNSDKFFATVFANGDIHIDGADKEPLNINANISTGRGSVFAYDAATPDADAITNSNFITFRDKTPQKTNSVLSNVQTINGGQSAPGSKQPETNTNYKYEGDIYMNININLNNNCEIKLRMDNTEDGYMSTYGHGELQAIFHNKSPFKLHGTYHIDNGKYRLFLQDMIYRDLSIQSGSQVDFQGPPFDADIHLICHHTLNSVPLSDLTASTAYSYNNKVKVVCILDITGTLANMDFNFDLDLPNVNEETKQLVRSMINSEEERNTQLIYLLGLGRFYPNEYARAANEESNSSAVSSLLSSTLSGQINQMLTNAMGKDSKWNFGTGLTTGENGWEDLDVEGILSGRLLNDRLLINGNFGYRDNSLTQTSSFIGDFDVRWKISETGNTYIKAYNQANDRYFTKATLNTQGIGISYERDFETWWDLFRFLKKRKAKEADSSTTTNSK